MEENELQTLEAAKPQKQRDKQSVGNDFDRCCFVWVHKKDAGNSLEIILIGLLRWGLKKKAGNRLDMSLVKNCISQDPLETLISERSSLGLGDML